MKIIKKIENRLKKQEKVVARFGTARLIQNGHGGYELRGGTKADRFCAIEWVSMFMHEATPEIR